jgi:hypothetical protein
VPDILYTDRSRSQAYRRCPRQRYLEYHAGPQSRGIVPVRKSIHLIIGLAFHAGAEVLLRRAMEEEAGLDAENNAVQAALQELSLHLAAGVELDVQEQPEKGAEGDGTKNISADLGAGESSGSSTGRQDSPIVIEFPGQEDFSQPIYPTASSQDEESRQAAGIEIQDAANLAAATGVDDYLKLELAALIEAMVRAYARRRLKPLLEEFEVLEVEREGTWKLGDIPTRIPCAGNRRYHDFNGGKPTCIYCGFGIDEPEYPELWWMSRHDGLLLERQTQQLYLLSYKTTGSWDRRKKQDAEIDMQGLSEAVDVERRLGEAWQIIRNWVENETYFQAAAHLVAEKLPQVLKRVSPRMASWLSTQPAPPRILGVRYEYILKGARRQDKKDPVSPGRYVQDTPLIRAYRSDGVTLEDRRWAPNYEWNSADGKTRRIDYRSWKKSPVWETLPISQWIDMLDQGDYWPGKGDDFDAAGHPTDILSDQFVPPVTVWRNEDDMRDWLEQVEAQEVQIVQDAAAIAACGEDEGKRRSELNRRFPQNRNACCWPGPCSFMKICYGGEDIRRDPLGNSDLYKVREANHPIEMAVSE